jgi:N-methylhydantoinase A
MSANSRSNRLRIGVDIGGTFTDLVFLRPDGKLDKRKTPSTPSDYARAIIEAVTAYCAEQGVAAPTVSEIVHATTIATNAILERKGVKTALLTTEGFRDVLELRRIRIPLSYDLTWKKPEPLVDRWLRLPVRERIDAQGNVLVPLDLDHLHGVIAELAGEKVEAVAVSLLHAYRDPSHERLVGEKLRAALPGVSISLSSDVLPEMLEFERTSTTVVNAYIAPLIARYLEQLRRSLGERGVKAPILVMQSNGGLVSANSAARRPVTIIESGPAAGVVAAARLARDCGITDLITLDMGGTTTKASIIERGEMLRAAEYEVGSAVSVSSRLVRGGGYLLRIPVIDISEVGAGGGSIAAVDAGGSLRVGPRSAGAVPGPACYGQGNDQPTVTDANVVLGFISSDSLAGGALQVDKALAEAAIRRAIAEPANMPLLDAAHGVHVVANSNMVRAIKSVSVERGRDPADFAMMAFGGAGPIHAVGVARSLGIRRVLIPPAPGVFSSYGLLSAEIEHHSARTVLAPTQDMDYARLRSAFGEMRQDLLERVQDEGYSARDVTISALIDLRYRGQSSELTVPVQSVELDEPSLRAAEEAFEQEYERTYGHRGSTKAFELVTVRLVATVARPMERDGGWTREHGGVESGTRRAVSFGPESGQLIVPVLARSDVAASPQQGPMLIQEYDTTIVVPPDCAVQLDRYSNVVIDIGQSVA